jgi:hypothetical protein
MSNSPEANSGVNAGAAGSLRQALERFENARQLWANPTMRERLTAHWLTPGHPDRERFLQNREALEEALSTLQPTGELREFMQTRGINFDELVMSMPAVTDESILSDRDLHTMQEQFSVSRHRRTDDGDRLKSSIEAELEMMRRKRRGIRGDD